MPVMSKITSKNVKTDTAAIKRGRGRPKGSKNGVKAEEVERLYTFHCKKCNWSIKTGIALKTVQIFCPAHHRAERIG